MFKKRIEYSKIKTGFAPACFKVACALHNHRFTEKTTRVLDIDPKSYLPNLKRALIMKIYSNECTPIFENHFLTALRNFPNEMLIFSDAHGWVNINEDNYDDLEFPQVTAETNQRHVFDSIDDNNVYWAAIGPYEIKTAMNYLNLTTNPEKFFESQYLSPESKLYEDLQRIYFPGKSTQILRLRIPSSHKPSGFNSKGYKVFIGYNKVINFVNQEPEMFQVDKVNLPPADILRKEPHYYFKYVFEFSLCTCKTGRRTMGLCAHRMAAVLFFGTDINFNRTVYRAMDASSYRPSYENIADNET